MKILIPTCRPREDLTSMIESLDKTSNGLEIFASCQQGASASINRNLCLDQIHVGETAIMLDDDVEGFYDGWVNDMLFALFNPRVVVASARLLKANGEFGPTCSRCMDPYPLEIEVKRHKHCVLPTAAIIFRHHGHRFDENFIGSGWEDNSWMAEYCKADLNAIFVQSNRCKLIHLNCMSNQKNTWDHNKSHFFTLWPNGIAGAVDGSR